MALQLTRQLLIETIMNNKDIECCWKIFETVFCSIFLKALEDEDGDTENIQIQLSTDSSTRKGGKAKGQGNLAIDLAQSI